MCWRLLECEADGQIDAPYDGLARIADGMVAEKRSGKRDGDGDVSWCGEALSDECQRSRGQCSQADRWVHRAVSPSPGGLA